MQPAAHMSGASGRTGVESAAPRHTSDHVAAANALSTSGAIAAGEPRRTVGKVSPGSALSCLSPYLCIPISGLMPEWLQMTAALAAQSQPSSKERTGKGQETVLFARLCDMRHTC